MKQILVIGSVSVEETEVQAQSDMKEFVQGALDSRASSTCAVSACFLDEVGYVVDSQTVAVYDLKNGRDIKDYDLIFFRGKLAAQINIASTVATYAQMHRVPCINSAYSKRRPVGKVPQMLQLVELGLPVPKTVSANSQYLPQLIADHLQYPVIVKDVVGAHGRNNFLVHDEAELHRTLGDNPGVTFMAQEFIPNEGDYRVLLVGDELAIIHRQSQGDSHLNNTSVGGKATLVPTQDFPEQIIVESRKFADHCNYEIAGVDAIIDKTTGKHYFLEINSQPQLASGAFVELKSELLAKQFCNMLGLNQ